jgi:hypothetical protein
MRARPGDHLVIEPKKVGVAARRGEILEVLPGSGGDHYRVRWEDDQHESIYFPAPGARIEPATPRAET